MRWVFEEMVRFVTVVEKAEGAGSEGDWLSGT